MGADMAVTQYLKERSTGGGVHSAVGVFESVSRCA